MIFEWLLAGSAAIIFTLSTYIFHLRKKLQYIKQRPQSEELQEFVADLMSGSGVLLVKRISPGDIYLRAPKNG